VEYQSHGTDGPSQVSCSPLVVILTVVNFLGIAKVFTPFNSLFEPVKFTDPCNCQEGGLEFCLINFWLYDSKLLVQFELFFSTLFLW
jgi:hypothetical protein